MHNRPNNCQIHGAAGVVFGFMLSGNSKELLKKMAKGGLWTTVDR